jgi:ketosteroid isomerase-like protein
MRPSPLNRSIAALLAVSLGLVGPGVASEGSGIAGLAERLHATEEAFARTMADRDHEAFTSYLAEEAVFFGRGGEIRGKEAVAAAWKPFFETPDAPFAWAPEVATVLDSGTLGLTSGPIFAPDGRRIGTFNSVWRRQPDGSWQVVFDRGCPDCDCSPPDSSR